MHHIESFLYCKFSFNYYVDDLQITLEYRECLCNVCLCIVYVQRVIVHTLFNIKKVRLQIARLFFMNTFQQGIFTVLHVISFTKKGHAHTHMYTCKLRRTNSLSIES